MCGIFGLTLKEDFDTFAVVAQSLRAMDYRGYDSSGICALGHEGFHTIKSPGPLNALSLPSLKAKNALGHIRWATHGAPTKENAHPFTTKHFSLVHNGTIDNIPELKTRISTAALQGETDSEIVAHLLDIYFEKEQSAFLAFEKTLALIKGQWGFAAMCKSNINALLFARQGSPVIIGQSPSGFCISSDAAALPKTVSHVIFLQDGDYGFITPETVVIYNDKKEVQRDIEPFTASEEQDSQDGFSSYFLKEIFQGPHVARTILKNAVESYETLTLTEDFARATKVRTSRVHLVACGSSYYAATLARLWMRTLSCLNANTYIASEYNWQCAHKSLVIFISQSGETADILRLMRPPLPTKTLGLINRPHCALKRLVNTSLLLHAGTEKSVAATKSFLAQIITLFLMALIWARTPNSELWTHVPRIPQQLSALEDHFPIIQAIELPACPKAFIFIGNEDVYPIALEGSLKLKELSYIPSLAQTFINAPLMYISRKTFVVVLINSGEEALAHRTIATALENNASILVITNGPMDIPSECTHVSTPLCHKMVFPIIATPYVHVLAHVIAHKLDRNIDRPRNLAKSVTVE